MQSKLQKSLGKSKPYGIDELIIHVRRNCPSLLK